MRTLRVVEPAEVWLEHVANRHVIYLDSNVWIKMTDQRSDEAKECVAECQRAVASGEAIFPLSFPSISELLHQPDQSPQVKQGELMDQLSCGVTYRSSDRIQQHEAVTAFEFFAGHEFQPVPRSVLFSYVADYLGDGKLEFPDEWRDDDAERMRDYAKSSPAFRSVVWLLQHLDLNDIRARHDVATKRYVAELTSSIAKSAEHFRQTRNFSTERLRQEERVALFKSIVLPAFRGALLDRYSIEQIPERLATIGSDFNRRHGKGGPRVLAKLLDLMPMTELHAQCMASRTHNPTRAVRAQDFWDTEHARFSAYSDVFVTLDRGLIDTLANRCSVPRNRGRQVIGTLSGLTTFLKS